MTALAVRHLSIAGFAALTLSACGDSPSSPGNLIDLPACATGTAVFSVPPLPLEFVSDWVPLGNLSPPAHVFPTDHQYINGKSPAPGQAPPSRTVSSPGDIHVVRARSTHYQQEGFTDYSIEFQPCAEIYGYFGHIRSLAPALTSGLGAFDQRCSSYSPQPGVTVTTCETRPGDVFLAAGDVIGAAPSVDFGLHDRRIPSLQFANASRWRMASNGFDTFHVVAPSEYYSEPMRSEIAAYMGAYNGQRRTIPPLGGRIDVDLPGTAQGAWFKPGLPTYPESPHAALVPDVVDPSRQALVVGVSHAGQQRSATIFQPALSGSVNRAFHTITPGPTIYCYENLLYGLALLRLDSAVSLTLDIRDGPPLTCATAGPLSFTSASVQYER